jgi:hypothetical protein
MKYIISLLLLLTLTVYGQRTILVDTNGFLLSPSALYTGTKGSNEVIIGTTANASGHHGISLMHDGTQGIIECVNWGVIWEDLTIRAKRLVLMSDNASSQILWDGLGNLGIGCFTPSAKLHIISTNGSGIIIDCPSGNNHLTFENSSLVRWTESCLGNDLYFYSPSNGNILVQGTSRLGIGTVAPSALLHLYGNYTGQIIQNPINTSYSSLRIYNDQSNSVRSLEFDYSGSAYPTNQITGGTVGESAAITTTGSYPLEFGTAGVARMSIGAAGNVTVLGADNGTAMTVKINATQANVTASDTFIDFRSTSGSEGSVAGTAVAGVLAYNTFTGSHYTEMVNSDARVGQLLEATGDVVKGGLGWTNIIVTTNITKTAAGAGQNITTNVYIGSPKGQLVMTRLCETRKSKAAWGVYLGTDKEGRAMVGSIGTGMLDVANKEQDIEVGDWLMSSDVRGCAELQVLEDDKTKDDAKRNYTIGKALQPIRWNGGETHRVIAVTYHGG